MPPGLPFDPGHFPFGRPNTQRPMRHPGSTDPAAMVVGVYPSAFHISWTPPAHVELPNPHLWKSRKIGSLAVDVEPVVFWNGTKPSPASCLEDWVEVTSFEKGTHGQASPGTNGPSGSSLEKTLLGAWPLDPEQLAYTDAVPWYFVERGSGGQHEAMSKKCGPIVADLGLHPGSIPIRPSPKQLVEIAATTRRDGLRSEMLEANAPLVITLGQEALDSVRAVADEVTGVQQTLGADDAFGDVGRLEVGGREFDLCPLVHPGFVGRIAKRPEWKAALAAWQRKVGLS